MFNLLNLARICAVMHVFEETQKARSGPFPYDPPIKVRFKIRPHRKRIFAPRATVSLDSKTQKRRFLTSTLGAYFDPFRALRRSRATSETVRAPHLPPFAPVPFALNLTMSNVARLRFRICYVLRLQGNVRREATVARLVAKSFGQCPLTVVRCPLPAVHYPKLKSRANGLLSRVRHNCSALTLLHAEHLYAYPPGFVLLRGKAVSRLLSM